MKKIVTDKAPGGVGPYSQAIVSGNFVFTSGQTARDPKTKEFVGSDIKTQTEQAIKNLKAVLEASGSDLEHIVKAECLLLDMAEFPAFNEVYAKYITEKPARCTMAVSGLAKGALVEIEAIAELK